MEQNPESLNRVRIIAIISDVTTVSLMEMDRSGAYWGLVTEHFPESEWNRVSRIMNFADIECDAEMIDSEGVVTFTWDNVKKLIFRQGLVFDRRVLEPNNIQGVKVKGSAQPVKKTRRFGFKKKSDCGCRG